MHQYLVGFRLLSIVAGGFATVLTSGASGLVVYSPFN